MNYFKFTFPVILVLCAFCDESKGFRIDRNSDPLSNTSIFSSDTSLWNNETTAYQVNIGFNVDIVGAIRLAWEKHRYAKSNEGFVRGLMNELTYNHLNKIPGPDWGIMIFHLGNHYEWRGGPFNLHAYQTLSHGDRFYGVWIFQCGHFINHGARGWGEWMFTGNCFIQAKVPRSNEALFESATCPGRHRSTHWC